MFIADEGSDARPIAVSPFRLSRPRNFRVPRHSVAELCGVTSLLPEPELATLTSPLPHPQLLADFDGQIQDEVRFARTRVVDEVRWVGAERLLKNLLLCPPAGYRTAAKREWRCQLPWCPSCHARRVAMIVRRVHGAVFAESKRRSHRGHAVFGTGVLVLASGRGEEVFRELGPSIVDRVMPNFVTLADACDGSYQWGFLDFRTPESGGPVTAVFRMGYALIRPAKGGYLRALPESVRKTLVVVENPRDADPSALGMAVAKTWPFPRGWWTRVSRNVPPPALYASSAKPDQPAARADGLLMRRRPLPGAGQKTDRAPKSSKRTAFATGVMDTVTRLLAAARKDQGAARSREKMILNFRDRLIAEYGLGPKAAGKDSEKSRGNKKVSRAKAKSKK